MTEATNLRMVDGKPDGITPSQTVGPFFAYMLTPGGPEYSAAERIFFDDLVTPDAVGSPIRIEGYILDGDGEPIVDALVELWQPDGDGRFAGQAGANTAFRGFGRTDVDTNGFFSFRTVRPGVVPGPNGGSQAPHINVSILARGVLKRLFTRIYFEGESANESDPILALVPAERRKTLIALRKERGGDTVYTFNIRLQGGDETVFFEA